MLAGIGAVVLAAQVILTQIPFDSGPAWDLLALAMGVIIAPLLSLGLAWSVERVAAARAATT